MNDQTLNKITIIIPTYNRSGCLRQLLDYYNSYKVDYEIIVADSSSDKNKALNKEIISSFPNLKILYLGDYSEQIKLFDKFADSVNYAKSKYCLFCADDDFITPNGINQSMDFLENNPDYQIAQGSYLFFIVKTKKRGEKKFYWSFGYSHQSITSSDPKLRLTKHLSNYSQPTLYGVHRTDFLRMISKETIKYTNDGRFGEFLPSVLTLIYGKAKCLDVLYSAREVIPNSLSGTNKTIYDFIREGSYYEKYIKFKNCLAAHLTKKSQLDIEESKKLIDNAMAMYMKFDYKHFLMDKIKYILDTFRAPDWIYHKIRSFLRFLYGKYIFFTKVRKKYKCLDSLDGFLVGYQNDFNRIRTQVISCAKTNE